MLGAGKTEKRTKRKEQGEEGKNLMMWLQS